LRELGPNQFFTAFSIFIACVLGRTLAGSGGKGPNCDSFFKIDCGCGCDGLLLPRGLCLLGGNGGGSIPDGGGGRGGGRDCETFPDDGSF